MGAVFGEPVDDGAAVGPANAGLDMRDLTGQDAELLEYVVGGWQNGHGDDAVRGVRARGG